MNRVCTAVLALAVLAAPAPGLAADFESAAAKAERLDRLDGFLERFIGRCADPYTRAACEKDVAAFRKDALGKSYVVKIQEATSLVRPEREGDGFVLLLTPFFDGGGLALTGGTPTKQDPAGNPLVQLVPVRSVLPPGSMDLEFLSPFRTGAIEVELVFRPLKAWKLPKKGGGSIEGVGAKLVAVRVLDGRTGNELGARMM